MLKTLFKSAACISLFTLGSAAWASGAKIPKDEMIVSYEGQPEIYVMGIGYYAFDAADSTLDEMRCTDQLMQLKNLGNNELKIYPSERVGEPPQVVFRTDVEPKITFKSRIALGDATQSRCRFVLAKAQLGINAVTLGNEVDGELAHRGLMFKTKRIELTSEIKVRSKAKVPYTIYPSIHGQFVGSKVGEIGANAGEEIRVIFERQKR